MIALNSIKRKSLFLLTGALFLAACQSAYVDVKPVTSGKMADAGLAGKSYYDLGKSYLESSDLGLAIEAFRQDIRTNGDNVQALNGLAVSYDRLGRYDISQKYYNKALELEPRSPVTFNNLAYSQYLQGQYDNATALADMAGELVKAHKGGKQYSLAKIATGNKKIALKEKEETKESTGPFPANYSIERVGQRDWALAPHQPKFAKKNDVKYKSGLDLAGILYRARQEKIQNSSISKSSTYSVLNGTGRPQMAKRVAQYFAHKGLKVQKIGNSGHYGHELTVVKFSPGYKSQAMKLARTLPVTVKVKESHDLKANVELTLGADLLSFDTSLFNRHPQT